MPEHTTTMSVPTNAKSSKPLKKDNKASKGSGMGISANEPMSEAARKILAYHFAKMKKEEPRARSGEDIEGVHDMRVATRRLRSAFQLLEGYFERNIVRRFQKELRTIADVLGEVRDLEVFIQKTESFINIKPKAEISDNSIQVMVHDWKDRLANERAELAALFDSEDYQDFLNDFEDFVTIPGRGTPKLRNDEPRLVRHILPILIYEKLANVRAYDQDLKKANLDQLHQLRIQTKRLRYALESFEGVLGPQAKVVIGATRDLQEHLGSLQDARTAAELIQGYITDTEEEAPKADVVSYLASQEAEKQHLMKSAPSMWDKFMHRDVREALALAIAVL